MLTPSDLGFGPVLTKGDLPTKQFPQRRRKPAVAVFIPAFQAAETDTLYTIFAYAAKRRIMVHTLYGY